MYTVPVVFQTPTHKRPATTLSQDHPKAALQRNLQLLEHPHNVSRFQQWPVHTALVTTPALPISNY